MCPFERLNCFETGEHLFLAVLKLKKNNFTILKLNLYNALYVSYPLQQFHNLDKFIE